MNWSNIPNGYEFRIHMNHGNHSANVEEIIRCSLNEEDFQKHIKVLKNLVEAVEINFEKCTEDVAQYIEKKTGISEAEIMKMIERVIMTDIKWEDFMARPQYIEVFRYEDGKVQKSRI